MQYILTLHMATDWDASGRLKGQTDISLNAEGKRAAARFARALDEFGIARIASSDLSRARETAEIIQRRLRVPLTTDARLRECAFGDLEGLTKDEQITKHGDAIASRWPIHHDAYDFRPFGGECRDDVLARHLDAFRALTRDEMARHPALIVGHYCGLRTLLVGLGYDADLVRGEYRMVTYDGDAGR